MTDERDAGTRGQGDAASKTLRAASPRYPLPATLFDLALSDVALADQAGLCLFI
ncbi:MAG: hypothetical protein ACR2LZ_02285 [Pyrinomonadaceae bacterium]